MKKIIFFISVCLVWTSLSAQSYEKIKMKDLMNQVVSYSKPIVLNMWATWCAPCIEELPYLNDGVKAYKDRDLELWLVSLDFPRTVDERLTKFIKDNNYKARYFWLDENNADEFCPLLDPKWDGNIPVTLFYNPTNLYRKFMNRALTKAQVSVELEEMFKEKDVK